MTNLLSRYMEDVFGKAALSDPCEPRPSHLVQKVSGILGRAIKRMQRMDEMYEQSEDWKVIQEMVCIGGCIIFPVVRTIGTTKRAWLAQQYERGVSPGCIDCAVCRLVLTVALGFAGGQA